MFSPEPNAKRQQIETIISAIKAAKHSVLFCIFTPTDQPLRQACFEAGDRGLMMFGIVNNISEKSAKDAEEAEADGKNINSSALANMDLYHRSKNNKDVIDGAHFTTTTVPNGFESEVTVFPGEKPQDFAAVVIHHKLIVIDAEGDSPIVYSGSANMSNNSEHNNDENLIEMKDRRIAAIYIAEFMRLYEHYRARAIAIRSAGAPAKGNILELQADRRWADKYYKKGSPESKARIAMAASPP